MPIMLLLMVPMLLMLYGAYAAPVATHTVAKRSADAAPDAEADAYYYGAHGRGYGYGHRYGHSAYYGGYGGHRAYGYGGHYGYGYGWGHKILYLIHFYIKYCFEIGRILQL